MGYSWFNHGFHAIVGIKPLQKIDGFPDEAYEILADAIAYHPSKLPVQAYLDYQKDSSEN